MIWFWLVLTVCMFILEICTTALVSIWFVAGGITGLVLAAVHMPVWIQILGFAAVSALLLLTCRDWLVRHFQVRKTTTSTERLMGEIGVVTTPIDPHEGGRILVKGQDWKAISVEDEPVAIDRKVKVVGIQGVKLEVLPVPERAERV